MPEGRSIQGQNGAAEWPKYNFQMSDLDDVLVTLWAGPDLFLTCDVIYKRTGHKSERAISANGPLSHATRPFNTQHQFSHLPNISPPLKEARLILANY